MQKDVCVCSSFVCAFCLIESVSIFNNMYAGVRVGMCVPVRARVCVCMEKKRTKEDSNNKSRQEKAIIHRIMCRTTRIEKQKKKNEMKKNVSLLFV